MNAGTMARFLTFMCCAAEVTAPSKELFELLKADVDDSQREVSFKKSLIKSMLRGALDQLSRRAVDVESSRGG